MVVEKQKMREIRKNSWRDGTGREHLKPCAHCCVVQTSVNCPSTTLKQLNGG